MRKPILIVLGVLGGLLAIGAAVLLLVDVNQFREPIRAQLEKRLNRSVSIGKLGLKLIPLSIRLDDVAIGESPKYPSSISFLSAKQMYVQVGLAALLRRQVDVESLHILQPAVELVRNPNGEWNAASLGESSGGGEKSTVGIADLRIEDGRIAITDLQQKRPRAVYDHIDIALRDFKPGKRFGLDAQVHLPAKGTELVKAHLAANTPGPGQSLMGADLDGDVSLEAVSLTGLQAFLGSPPSQAAKAVFNGKAEFKSRGGVLEGKGNIGISEPRLKEPARIEFDVRDESGPGLLTVSNATLKLGGLALSGNATVRGKESPATVTGGLRADNASVADVLRVAAAFGVAEGITGTGTLSVEAHASGPANAISYAATGSVREANLTFESLRKPVEIQSASLKLGKDDAAIENLVGAVGSSHIRGSAAVRNFAHPDLQFNAEIDRLDAAEMQQLVAPSTGKKSSGSGAPDLNGAGTISVGTLTYNQIALNDVRATCKLDNGVVRLDPLTAKLFGGTQAGSIAIDTRQQQTAFDVRSKLQRVDANKLLSATTSVKQIVFGMLSGDINLRASPQKGQEPASSLNGTVQILLTDGRLAGVQLLNEMAGIAQFLGYARSTDTFTNIVKLAGTMKIQNGVANTDDLQLQFDGGTMAAAGTAGLADRQLKMRVTTVLAKALSQRAGGNQIAGLMSTALSNSKGELVIPALVSGTFDKPRFEPDPQRIAKLKLEGLLPTHDNPLGAVSTVQGILGALKGTKSTDTGAKGEQPATPEANGQQQKKTSVFDIIDSVRKQTGKK